MEEYYRILDDKPLPKKDAEEIVELFFNSDEYFVGVPLYVRTDTPLYFLDKKFNFQLIQPFDCEIVIVANRLCGGNWESRELRGDYEDYQNEALEFIKDYIEKHITGDRNSKIEVDSDSFLRIRSKHSFKVDIVECDDEEGDFDAEEI